MTTNAEAFERVRFVQQRPQRGVTVCELQFVLYFHRPHDSARSVRGTRMAPARPRHSKIKPSLQRRSTNDENYL